MDETEVNVQKFFKEAYEFIDSALSEDSNHRVLIHCALGKSRSATVTIMYLMKKFQWSVEQVKEEKSFFIKFFQGTGIRKNKKKNC